MSHFGFIVLGIFVLNSQGLTGLDAVHVQPRALDGGAVPGDRVPDLPSRLELISDYGGVEKVAPVLAGIFLVAGLSSLSLPGLSPFISEFLVLVGTFTHNVVARRSPSSASCWPRSTSC